jgi:hypothetical protein
MPRNVIYQGDLEELKVDWTGRFIADGECARLPQELTDVGWTGRWLPGPRVVDLAFLLPGTVIANFKFVDGQWKYPNQHGYHAGLFQRYEYGRVMSNGKPAVFSMIDQWRGDRPKAVGERGLTAYTPEQAKQERREPSDNANEFYVVVVP